MDGKAEWTQIGTEQGLDHLAMLAPLETHYQSLLQGFSSVTTRLRNYSFYAFWVVHYARDIRNSSRRVFEDKTRRVEALYALAAMQREGETGVAGSNFASEKLAQVSDTIDFRAETDFTSVQSVRYLAPRGGAFPGVYLGQMNEIGLIGRGEGHGLPAPTDAARELAAAYEASLGGLAGDFFRYAEDGHIPRAYLAPMERMAPGAMDQDSEEADLLRLMLMGEDGSERLVKRRATLLSILEIARKKDSQKITADMLRWWWMDHEPQGTFPDTHRVWQHYQVGDMIRLVYESLLSHIIDALVEAKEPLSAPEVVANVVTPLPELSLLDWFKALSEADGSLKALQERGLSSEASIEDIIAPLARLWRDWRGRLDELATSYEDEAGLQTCLTELRWIEGNLASPAKEALEKLLFHRILRRHLEVAARKFRFQSSYTYLIETEDALLRPRHKAKITEDALLRPRHRFNITASGPRLATAVRFLEDIDFLNDGRLTPRGLAYLEAT